MNKNFGLANFGKSFGKSTSPYAAKVIKSLHKVLPISKTI